MEELFHYDRLAICLQGCVMSRQHHGFSPGLGNEYPRFQKRTSEPKVWRNRITLRSRLFQNRPASEAYQLVVRLTTTHGQASSAPAAVVKVTERFEWSGELPDDADLVPGHRYLKVVISRERFMEVADECREEFNRRRPSLEPSLFEDYE